AFSLPSSCRGTSCRRTSPRRPRSAGSKGASWNTGWAGGLGMQATAVILAAGQGTRMKSDLPKVLHPIAGRPMVHHVIRAVKAAGIERIVVVVGHGRDQVRAALADETAV